MCNIASVTLWLSVAVTVNCIMQKKSHPILEILWNIVVFESRWFVLSEL